VRKVLPYLLLTGLSLPFVAKPVHIDDTNFLVLARGAVDNAWAPHAISINWQGTTQRAFDVLSNPPGIAWWLAPVADAGVIWQHLWMLPWLWLATWGALRLGRTVTNRGGATAMLLMGCPAAVLATQSLTPDLPLLALVLAGMSGILRPISDTGASHRWGWALLVGAGALFRYSGAALIPVVMAWPWLHGDRRGAVTLGAAAALPMALLAGHDLMAYGAIHVTAMTGFQGVANTGPEVLHKAAASVAMLGGAVVLPVLCWVRPRRAITGLMVGAGLGCTAITVLGMSGMTAAAGLCACAAGGATIGGALSTKDSIDRLLSLWLGTGLLFLLALRFSATRYWLPFMVPAVLLCLRHARVRLVRAACLATVVLSVWLCVDDLELARAQEVSAERLSAHGTGLFAGHWGFQHHMEAAGWRALEDDTPVPPGTLLAVSPSAWPQVPSGCVDEITRSSVPDRWPGPRVHTMEGGANLHGHSLSAQPPQRTLAPWSLGTDDLDVAILYRGCAD